MTPTAIKPATFRLVAQHFNHCATAVSTTIGTYENLPQRFKELSEIAVWELTQKQGFNIAHVQMALSYKETEKLAHL